MSIFLLPFWFGQFDCGTKKKIKFIHSPPEKWLLLLVLLLLLLLEAVFGPKNRSSVFCPFEEADFAAFNCEIIIYKWFLFSKWQYICIFFKLFIFIFLSVDTSARHRSRSRRSRWRRRGIPLWFSEASSRILVYKAHSDTNDVNNSHSTFTLNVQIKKNLI